MVLKVLYLIKKKGIAKLSEIIFYSFISKKIYSVQKKNIIYKF